MCMFAVYRRADKSGKFRITSVCTDKADADDLAKKAKAVLIDRGCADGDTKVVEVKTGKPKEVLKS